MKTLAFLTFFLLTFFPFLTQAQQQIYFEQSGSGKSFLPEAPKSMFRAINDTIWVADSLYKYESGQEGLYISEKQYVTARNNHGLTLLRWGEYYNPDLDKWFLDSKDSTSYYGDTAVKDDFKYVWDGVTGKWVERFHSGKTRNGKPLLSERKDYSLTLHKYVDGMRQVSTYDDEYNYLIKFERQSLDSTSGEFVNESKNLYYHDINGQDSLTVFYAWNNGQGQWEIRGKVVSLYFPQTNTLEKTTYKTDDDGQTWYPDVKYTYHYRNDGKSDTIVFAMWDTQYAVWLNHNRYSYIYDDQGRRIEYTTENYLQGDSSWVYSRRYRSVFEDDKLKESIVYTYSSGEWKLLQKDILVYDGQLQTHQYKIVAVNDTTMDTTATANLYYDEHSNLDYYEYMQKMNGSNVLFFGYKYFWSRFFVNSVSKNEFQNLNVYPNPTGGIINISNPEAGGEPYTVQIFDMKGRKVYGKTFVVPSVQINLKKRMRGVYILKVESGTKVYVSKIVFR